MVEIENFDFLSLCGSHLKPEVHFRLFDSLPVFFSALKLFYGCFLLFYLPLTVHRVRELVSLQLQGGL